MMRIANVVACNVECPVLVCAVTESVLFSISGAARDNFISATHTHSHT